jgi:hypothetical protein
MSRPQIMHVSDFASSIAFGERGMGLLSAGVRGCSRGPAPQPAHLGVSLDPRSSITSCRMGRWGAGAGERPVGTASPQAPVNPRRLHPRGLTTNDAAPPSVPRVWRAADPCASETIPVIHPIGPTAQ